MTDVLPSHSESTPAIASNHHSQYGGVVAAMLTPCRAAGEPDPEMMRQLAGRLVEGGCDGLFVVGSTGEMPLLDHVHRAAIIAAAREGAGRAGGATLYAGTSGTGFKQTLDHIHVAADAGADVAVVMAPFTFKFNQVELQT